MTIYELMKIVGFEIIRDDYGTTYYKYKNYNIHIINLHHDNYYLYFSIGSLLIVNEEDVSIFNADELYDKYFKQEIRDRKINNLLK